MNFMGKVSNLYGILMNKYEKMYVYMTKNVLKLQFYEFVVLQMHK